MKRTSFAVELHPKLYTPDGTSEAILNLLAGLDPSSVLHTLGYFCILLPSNQGSECSFTLRAALYLSYFSAFVTYCAAANK